MRTEADQREVESTLRRRRVDDLSGGEDSLPDSDGVQLVATDIPVSDEAGLENRSQSCLSSI